MNVSAGGVGVWMLSTDIAMAMLVLFTRFYCKYAGSSSTTSVQIDVQPVADFTGVGALDGGFLPAIIVDVNLDLDNPVLWT